jgi:hypothetical protein
VAEDALMATEPAITAHQTWLGYIQPVGLVVSAPALASAQCALPLDVAARQATLQGLVPDGRIGDLVRFLGTLLDWQPTDVVAGDALTDLHVPLPEYGDILAPTWAVPKADNEPGWQLLVVQTGADLDATPPETASGWRASPQARVERLLREREVPVGILCNATDLRLVYAPRGESSGYLTFHVPDLLKVPGRPLLGALVMLLSAERLFTVPPNKRLPAVLKESRKYQSQVSNALAEQVLGALDDLLRGFEMADADRSGNLLRQVVDTEPQHVYGGLITVLLRLVFLLYAEERGLMSGDPVYVRHYAIAGLFEKLREDAGRHPDTMDQRYGAWARLLSLFRFVWQGGGDERLHLPGRRGSLFDPGIYAFLEGRAYRQTDIGEKIEVPRVPDGVVWRVLEKLLLLDGERLSYRALDVEQIGSVYEAMMGFELRRAYAPSVALRPKRVVVSVQGLLHATGAQRAKILDEEAQCKLTGNALDALKAAKTPSEVVAALGKKVVDGRLLPEGSLYLQPGEERRRSGSHYTPRSLTEPIVRTTLRPVLEALGDRPRPEQILALKVCDPAMGSGAFLVEACRQLADALVEAWSVHRCTPEIPPDEDPLLYARRLVAQRCLYGVDKNPYAVNLAKLSLWLVTLAKDHPFTFLDHALKHGDSLVGLTKRQIGRFDWSTDDDEVPPLIAAIEAALANARGHRDEIHAAGDDEDAKKRLAWLEAEDDVEPARAMGDLCIAAFFAADTDNEREAKRNELQTLVGRWRSGAAGAAVAVSHARGTLREAERPVVPLHWEVEFPEVFDRPNGGFDAIVGNPPFGGATTLAHAVRQCYPDFLRTRFAGAGGKCDLSAFFYRRAADILRMGGATGLIATNTIAQGDTRRSGLSLLVRSGFSIFEARRRVPWPGKASVIVSVVHLLKSREVGTPHLDGRRVQRISPYLLPSTFDDPRPISHDGVIAGVGSKPGSEGFIVGAKQANIPGDRVVALLRDEPAAAGLLQDYAGGSELYESMHALPSRRVFDLSGVDSTEAATLPRLLELLSEFVGKKPGNWWQFARHAADVREACSGLARVLVIAETSDTFAVLFLDSTTVASNKLVVFSTDSFGAFAVLQSRAHEAWARTFSSTMKDDLTYVPSAVFGTFPVPRGWLDNGTAPWECACRYYAARAEQMVRFREGATAIYNRFHDPDEHDPGILRLRELHAAMDRAVLDAYGWTDLQPTCEFLLDWEDPEDEEAEEIGKKSRRKKPWRLRWPDAIRDEVLARLLALNQQRAEEERKLAAPKDGKGAKARKPKATSTSKPPRAKKEHEPAQTAPRLFDGKGGA